MSECLNFYKSPKGLYQYIARYLTFSIKDYKLNGLLIAQNLPLTGNNLNKHLITKSWILGCKSCNQLVKRINTQPPMPCN